jgi:D-alanyl-D-alanine carboxypeptidase
MNHFLLPFRLRAVACFALCLLCIGAYGQGFSPETESRLQAVLESFVDNPDPAKAYVGGMSAAIHVDGLAQWEGASGLAATPPFPERSFTPATLSRIYSVTKTFTAALVLELVQEGKLSLSDHVSQFFPIDQLNASLNDQVTIHQLLSHQSGYSDFVSNPQFLGAVFLNPTKLWTPAEIVGGFVGQLFAPGTAYKYASTNYILLGAIVEQVTGKPIAESYRSRFFDPLGLSSAYFPPQESPGNRGVLADPHENLSPFNPLLKQYGLPEFPDAYIDIAFISFEGLVSAAYAGGGIVANVADLAKWGAALFGGRATSKETWRVMLNSIAEQPDEDGDYLGYGIFRTNRISATDVFIGHNGRAPGYRSLLFYQPDKKITIALLSNYAGADPYAVAKALYEALPDFTCGKKDQKVQVCLYGLPLCLPPRLAERVISYGAYLGGCVGCQPDNAPAGRESVAGTMQEAFAEPVAWGAAPNPLTDRSLITFSVEKTGPAQLAVYDAKGALLVELYDGQAEAGKLYQVPFDASRLRSGLYLGRLVTAGRVRTQKLVVTR